MAFTSGNDINILQTTDSAVVSAGSGSDTYIMAPGLLSAGQNVRITDGQGVNTLKLVGGLDIVASKVASNTAQLTLSNDAVITLNDVSSYQFSVGGTALTGGVEKGYATFTQDVLGVTPPASGVVTGGGATIHADGSVSTTQPESGPESLTLAEALALQTMPESYKLAEDSAVDAGELTVANAKTALGNATTLINGAGNAGVLDADYLFNWDVRDSAAAVLTTIDGNVPSHVADADTVQVTNDDVSQAELDALAELANFEQGDVTVTPGPDQSETFGYDLNYTNQNSFGQYFSDIDSSIKAALDHWGEQLDTASDAHLDIEVNYAPKSGNTLASAASYWRDQSESFNGDAVYTSNVQQALQTGEKIPYADSDALINIASLDLSSDNWWYDPTPEDRTDNMPGYDQVDFIGVILHEFGHALGFNSTYSYDSYFEQSYPMKTRFDTWIESNAAETQFDFSGPSAQQAYADLGGVGDVPLYVEPGKVGSNFAHYGGWGGEAGLLEGMLMNPAVGDGQRLDIQSLDLAILEDLGYDIEPGAPVLSTPSSEALEDESWLADSGQASSPEWLI